MPIAVNPSRELPNCVKIHRSIHPPDVQRARFGVRTTPAEFLAAPSTNFQVFIPGF
jgi:hypothetical protein